MKTRELTRRQFLKSSGALIVSFNLLPPAGKVFGAIRNFAIWRYRSDFTRFLACDHAGRLWSLFTPARWKSALVRLRR